MMSKVVLLAATAALAEGAAIKWTGIVNDQQWSTANNWYPAQVPGPDDSVTINDAEGKDAVVVLTSSTPVIIGSLSMGNLFAQTARLRVLAPLTVTNYVNVEGNGVLELNSGAAGVSCNRVTVYGELEFAAGTMTGNATVTGVMNFSTAAAKVLESCQITVKSEQAVRASGSLQFRSNSNIVTNVGVVATGQDFQCIVMDQSMKNSFVSPGFRWIQ